MNMLVAMPDTVPVLLLVNILMFNYERHNIVERKRITQKFIEQEIFFKNRTGCMYAR